MLSTAVSWILSAASPCFTVLHPLLVCLCFVARLLSAVTRSFLLLRRVVRLAGKWKGLGALAVRYTLGLAAPDCWSIAYSILTPIFALLQDEGRDSLPSLIRSFSALRANCTHSLIMRTVGTFQASSVPNTVLTRCAQVFHSLGALVALFVSAALAVHPVSIQGQDFVDTVTKKRFSIIGVDYQPGGQGGYKPQSGEDPLTDKDVCLRDAIMLQRLGVNTIRVYNVDPTFDHNDCASIFNAAGIYMILDVNGPGSGESINRDEPWTSYHEGYLTRIFGVVENFKGYPNTLAFFSANEVMNDQATGKVNPQYIRVSLQTRQSSMPKY